MAPTANPKAHPTNGIHEKIAHGQINPCFATLSTLIGQEINAESPLKNQQPLNNDPKTQSAQVSASTPIVNEATTPIIVPIVAKNDIKYPDVRIFDHILL